MVRKRIFKNNFLLVIIVCVLFSAKISFASESVAYLSKANLRLLPNEEVRKKRSSETSSVDTQPFCINNESNKPVVVETNEIEEDLLDGNVSKKELFFAMMVTSIWSSSLMFLLCYNFLRSQP